MSGSSRGKRDKSFEIEAIDIVRFEDGKCAEHWGVTDNMALMQQIGAIPEPAQA
ncbi:MAG TPA: ester cyclase [Solirubrobacterales bacterium]|nr:ester cyclase [Solirubrobacterales bacterium]